MTTARPFPAEDPGGPRFPASARREEVPSMTLTATPRHQGASMRHLILFVYIVVACWVAWSQRDSAWFVLHATGAISAICAAGLAISYAGALGEATPDDDPDQAEDYMREGWDD